MATKPAAKTATKTSTEIAKAKINLPANINDLFASEVAELQKRIGAPTGDRITITQAKTFKLPNGLEVAELECVVVDFVAGNFYYPTLFDRNNIVPPDCFALGLEPAGLVPSANSPSLQCDSCAGCWANQFKSAANGRGKACSNTRLLAVLPLDADSDTKPMILKVSSTGLTSFDSHVAAVAQSYRTPIRGVETRITFSDDAYASLRFATIKKTDKDLLAVAQSVKAPMQARLLTEPDVAPKAANDDRKQPRAPAKKVANARR